MELEERECIPDCRIVGNCPSDRAGFAAILLGTVKFGILNRKDPFKWARRLIPVCLSFTAAVLALFMVADVPDGD